MIIFILILLDIHWFSWFSHLLDLCIMAQLLSRLTLRLIGYQHIIWCLGDVVDSPPSRMVGLHVRMWIWERMRSLLILVHLPIGIYVKSMDWVSLDTI